MQCVENYYLVLALGGKREQGSSEMSRQPSASAQGRDTRAPVPSLHAAGPFREPF